MVVNKLPRSAWQTKLRKLATRSSARMTKRKGGGEEGKTCSNRFKGNCADEARQLAIKAKLTLHTLETRFT